MRRRSTPSPRSAASESVWGFVFALLAGSRKAGAAVAVIAASMLMTGAPAARALVEATGAPQTAGAPSPAPHVHRPPAAPDDLRAQQTPTPDDDIPDVSLTLGGPSHTVDVEGYFTDSVNGYAVSGISARHCPHLEIGDRVITIKPIARRLGDRHRHRHEVRSRRAEAIHRHRVGHGRRSHGDRQHRGGDTSPRALRTLLPPRTTSREKVRDVRGGVLGPGASPLWRWMRAAVTVTAIAAGSATITVTATNSGGSAGAVSYAVTVVPLAPTATGSIAAATLTEGATHAGHCLGLLRWRGGGVRGGILGYAEVAMVVGRWRGRSP